MKIEGQILGQILGQNANVSTNADILSKLGIGDILKARVVEIKNSEIFLKMLDGSTFSTAALNMTDVKKGDMVEFVVNDKIGSQVFMELVKPEAQKPANSPETDIKKVLADIDVKPDEKNVEIAKELKANNVPISKEGIQSVLDAVTKFKGLTPAKAVYLLTSQLPCEEKNISELNHLLEDKFKIGAKLEGIFAELEGIQDEFFQNKVQKAFGDLNVKGARVAQQPQEVTVNKALQELNQIDIPEQLKPMDLPKKAVEFVARYSDVSLDAEMPLTDFLNSTGINLEKLPKDRQVEVINLFRNLILKVKEKTVIEGNASAELSFDVNVEKSVLKKTFEDLFVKVDKDTNGDDINASKIYKDIYSKLETLKSLLDGSNIENKADISMKIENFQSSIKFMNEINNSTTYIQIPLNIWNKNTTGELYVLKRDSKKKKIDPENAVLYLALNTLNMGQVDSLVFIDKKNISLNFRLESEEIINFFKENYIQLNDKITQNGYKLVGVRYKICDKDINILNIKKTLQKDLDVFGNVAIDYKV